MTPLDWQQKQLVPDSDLDANFVDDEIDALLPTDTVDLIVRLNRCAEPDEVAALSALGSSIEVGKYVSYVVLTEVQAQDAVALGDDALVSFVTVDSDLVYFMDVASPAIRVGWGGSGSAYSGANIEQVYPLIDGTDVNVAIVDSGVDDDLHEQFLPSRFVAGFDATTNPGTAGNPDDEVGHGTRVAGALLGDGDAAGNRVGIAPAAGLIDVRVSTLTKGPKKNRVLRALQWILDNGQADVVNMSLGVQKPFGSTCKESDGTDEVSAMANRMVAAGMIFVASMGNASSCGISPPGYGAVAPGAADDAITVSAVDDGDSILRTDDEFVADSLHGPRESDGDGDTDDELKPDLSAPGFGISVPQPNSANGYSLGSGTTYSSALVAGCAALVRQAAPTLPPRSVKDLLIATAEDFGATGWDDEFGHGIVDCFAAIDSLELSPAKADLAFDVYYCRPGNSPVCWESPDVRPLNPVVRKGRANSILARVENKGPVVSEAATIVIGVHDFSNGDPNQTICTRAISPLAPGAVQTFVCPWTPKTKKGKKKKSVHACVKAEIVYRYDPDPTNNFAQHNVNIIYAKSPAETTMLVENPTSQALTMQVHSLVIGACPADQNGDGVIGSADYAIVTGNLGTTCDPSLPICTGDVDGNYQVDIADVAALQTQFGGSCPEDWTFTPGLATFEMQPSECPVELDLSLAPGLSLAPSAAARISITGTPIGGGAPIALGGVTIVGTRSVDTPALSGAMRLSLLGAVGFLGIAVFRSRRRSREPRAG